MSPSVADLPSLDLLPQAYTVPRGGQLVRVMVGDLDAVRSLRTELELLRRIQQSCVWGSQPAGTHRQAEYCEDDRRELAQILRDAQQPIVSETITEIDQAFGQLREEISMSHVQEEAETIVQEALASGALTQAGTEASDEPAPEESASQPTAPSDAVESEVAEAPATEAATVAESAPEADEQSAENEAALPESKSADTAEQAPAEEALAEEAVAEEPAAEEAVAEEPAAEEAVAEEAPAEKTLAEEAIVEEAGAESADEQVSVAETEPTALESALEQPVPEQPALESTNANEADDTAQDNLAESLATAEAELAEAIGLPPGDQRCETENTTELSEPDGATPDESAPRGEPDAVAEQEAATEPPLVPAVPEEPAAEAGGRPVSQEPMDQPGQAEQAFAQIQVGTAKLAELLNAALTSQWTRSKAMFEELASLKDRAAQTCGTLDAMLREIERAKQEVCVARADADAARTEARSLREDARRAKERAEAAAAAAEIAATQASKDAVSATSIEGM